MKLKTFFDYDQARSYLTGSIIRIKGKAAEIKEVHTGEDADSYILYYSHPSSPYILSCAYTAEDVNLDPIPLGFLSTSPERQGVSPYLQRRPGRDWKMGLTYNSLSAIIPDVNLKTKVSKQAIIRSKEFEDTVEGKYIPFDLAVKLADKNCLIPFSRSFAVTGGNLVYKTTPKPVGIIRDGLAVLEDKFKYLQQSLDEAVA